MDAALLRYLCLDACQAEDPGNCRKCHTGRYADTSGGTDFSGSMDPAAWGDPNRVVPIVGNGTSTFRYRDGASTGEAKAELRKLAREDLDRQPNSFLWKASPESDDSAYGMVIEGRRHLLPWSSVFHGMGRRTKANGPVIASLGTSLNASVAVPGIKGDRQYRISATNYGEPGFVVFVFDKGKTGEDILTDAVRLHSLNSKADPSRSHLSAAGMGPPGTVSISQLRRAWQEVFVPGLQAYAEQAKAATKRPQGQKTSMDATPYRNPILADILDRIAAVRARSAQSAPAPVPKAASLAEHDRRYHPEGYQPGDPCRLRDQMKKADRADVLPLFAAPKGPAPAPRHHDGARVPLDNGPVPGGVAILPTPLFRRVLKETPPSNRIAAFSDLHYVPISDIDIGDSSIVLVGGDFNANGATSESRQIDMAKAVETGMDALRKEFFPFCRKHADKTFVVIAGNHDHFLSDPAADGIDWPENVVYLRDAETSIGGMRVYGTPWCERRKGSLQAATPLKFSVQPFEVSEEELEERYGQIPEGLDILLVHQPPLAEGYDGDGPPGSHYGSAALTRAILRAKPKLVVCGHQHEGGHLPWRLGDSVVVNVAAVGSGRGELEHATRQIVHAQGPEGTGFLLDGEDPHRLPPRLREDTAPMPLRAAPVLPGFLFPDDDTDEIPF